MFRSKRGFNWQGLFVGLGAGGKEGVTKCLEIIKNSLDETIAILGEKDVNNLNRENILLENLNTRKF